jgi:hypothetical protein
MNSSMDYPLLVFVLSLVTLSLSGWLGRFLGTRQNLDQDAREDYNAIQAATLMLLSLIIGFTFSMAISRYDQRKNYEEAEANAIGTEYVRVDLLPAADAARLRTLLLSYLDQRILFYETGNLFYGTRNLFHETRDAQTLRQINAQTARLQGDLWSTVQASATAQPTPVVALAVSGMNDVLNSQGYTQAAWWNRIPVEAWGLMGAIAICCNVLVGYGARKTKPDTALLLILPLVLSISFFLIADVDSPRGGLIPVAPENLVSLAHSLRAPVAKP